MPAGSVRRGVEPEMKTSAPVTIREHPWGVIRRHTNVPGLSSVVLKMRLEPARQYSPLNAAPLWRMSEIVSRRILAFSDARSMQTVMLSGTFLMTAIFAPIRGDVKRAAEKMTWVHPVTKTPASHSTKSVTLKCEPKMATAACVQSALWTATVTRLGRG